MLRLVPLAAVLALLVLPACQAQDQPPTPAEADTSATAQAADTPAPAPPDSVRMTDGGRVAMPAAARFTRMKRDSLWAEALRIHYNARVIDGHVDTPMHMLDDGYDLGTRHLSRESHVDLPRMYEGGLDAVFFSIYVAARYGEGGRAVQRARDMIAEVKRQVAAHPDSVAMAYTAEDVRRITNDGRKAILLGLEGGHALAASPDTLRALRDLGIRYVTLTHVNTNAWADASQTPPRWGGLNDLGREMVRTMNRLGVLVDLSHVSDSAFYDALAASEAPVIASHSSARALTPVVRNLSDEQLRAVAENGGVVMINFYEPMVNRAITPEVMESVDARLGNGEDRRRLWQAVFAERQARGLRPGNLEDIVAHIDHAVQVAGIDHVGLGSDFDGARMPRGMEDVTDLPEITYALLKRGYTAEELYKLLGGNALRVLEAAEQVAASY